MIPIPQFSPKNSLAGVVAGLFQNNEPGVWYDPSDFSTMFQDAAGTTPVTAVEQPVGLMLDKSKGLVLGPELVTNGDFSDGTTGWSLSGVSVAGGKLVASAAVNGADARQPGKLTSGVFYQVTYTVDSISGGGVRFFNAFQTGSTRSSPGTYTEIFTGTSTVLGLQFLTTGVSAVIDNISVRELPGNHAYQTTTTSRPVLSARYNLLTKTEQFDDVYWSKIGVAVSANTQTAPDGTLTADTITSTTGTNAVIFNNIAISAQAGTYTDSIYVKAGTAEWVVLSLWSGSSANGINQWVNIQTGTLGANSRSAGYTFDSSLIQDAGAGWYRISLTGIVPTGNLYWSLRMVDSDNALVYTNTTGKTVHIWGASLVPAGQSSLPYQRVNTATDYDADPSKFKPYLLFDGIDDWLVTNTITPGIDKVQVFAGVRKLSNATTIIAETSVDYLSNNGAFAVIARNTGGYGLGTRGTLSTSANVATGYSAPITNILAGIGDISVDQAILRVDGTQVASSTADQGTGNYGNYPLYIGRRGDTSLPFNGHLYSLIVRFGNNLPIKTIEKTEEWVNTKTAAIDWRDVTDSSSFRWNSATASPDAE